MKRAGSRRVKFKVTKLRFKEQAEDGIIWGEGYLDPRAGKILRTKVKPRYPEVTNPGPVGLSVIT